MEEECIDPKPFPTPPTSPTHPPTHRKKEKPHLPFFSTPIIMRHLATYLLLKLGGNDAPSAADVKTALASVGVEPDEGRLTTLLKVRKRE